MIIVNLKGGTGNQLFQYALGRYLATLNHTNVKLDINGLSQANITGDIYRPFALDAFAIQKELATPDEIKASKYPYGIFSKAWRWFIFHAFTDKNTLFRSSVLTWKGTIYLDGYWQSPRYFEPIRDILLTELQLVNPLSASAEHYRTRIQHCTAVSLHVRRGDYIKNPRVQKEFGPCSISYYKAAMAKIEKTVTKPTYFVFSDDITWTKENLPLPETTVFVQGSDLRDVEELMLMGACQHNIIANSSFSWWGAWLNPKYDKIVIAPTPWFDVQLYDRNLIPDSWIQLPKY